MCGLCGFTGEIVDRDAVLENMTEVITHRGPDSKGFYTDDKISMGVRRLSIIDLDNGSQPIYNEDKTLVLMFNGEIYNYKQLRKELQGKGIDCSLEEIEKDIRARDEQDMNREHSPLRQAADAVLIDSSAMTIQEVIDAIIREAENKGLREA